MSARPPQSTNPNKAFLRCDGTLNLLSCSRSGAGAERRRRRGDAAARPSCGGRASGGPRGRSAATAPGGGGPVLAEEEEEERRSGSKPAQCRPPGLAAWRPSGLEASAEARACGPACTEGSPAAAGLPARPRAHKRASPRSCQGLHVEPEQSPGMLHGVVSKITTAGFG
ncbi:unnamed protein product, partial [Prorocentrum cordatum]